MENNRFSLYIVNRSVRLLLILLLTISGSLSIGIKALAVATASTESIGLTLSPIRTELEIAPGTSVDGTLSITNTTQASMTVSLDAESFGVSDPQYDYVFDKETELTKWVHFTDTKLTLQKGETKQETYTVGVPISAEPGGRYISLFASYDTTSSTGDATISRQRVGSFLYITVSGDVTRNGTVVTFDSPTFVGGKSQWSTAIRNDGTTHFRSRYSVSVQSLIGSGSIAGMTGNALILPGTVRLVTDNLPLPQLPGIYKVIYTIGLGDTPAVTEIRYIVYVPPVVVVVLSVAIILIISLLTQKVRKRRTSRSVEQQYKSQK